MITQTISSSNRTVCLKSDVRSALLSLYRTLSQIIHAVAALLYPFTWQHTLISIVPEILIDVVMAPTPYLLGVQKRLLDQVTDQSDVSHLQQNIS